jgi:tRNA C32,U32 (ribose-2'-O)-methylase TrmJ
MGQTKFMSIKNSKSLTKKIYILFNKANLESDEVNMLLGMLNSINKKLNK